jgi:ATP-dependent RNA helicase RhlE
MKFTDLGIVEPILKALQNQGYTRPTPIQEQAIPILLHGYDLLGCAQTGTGKTAAFAIPILQRLYGNHRASQRIRTVKSLIVTPTRELAIQIGDSLKVYGKYTGLKNTVIFGGVKQGAQTQILRRGVDVLVATPGRLLDLIHQGYVTLDHIESFVLDEADRMLDMGFIHDIRKIIALLPAKRQSLFFSATLAPDIIQLSAKILGEPQTVMINPQQTTAENVGQSVYFVNRPDKTKLLVHILRTDPKDSVLIFSRTRHGADKIVRVLGRSRIKAAAIHGSKSQASRQLALRDFKSGRSHILVATDIAARGIDIEELSLVINYDLPNVPEMYVHRIGRTGRANASGAALSFCDQEERAYLQDIQKLISQEIPVITKHPFQGENLPFSNTIKKPTVQQPRFSRPKTSDRRKSNHFQRKLVGNPFSKSGKKSSVPAERKEVQGPSKITYGRRRPAAVAYPLLSE